MPGVEPGITTDFDGAPRIQDKDHNGVATADMGAFELNSNLAPVVEAESSADVGADALGQSSYSFSITYRDDSALAVATFDTADASVNGPSGALGVISAVPEVGSDGSPRTVAYVVEPVAHVVFQVVDLVFRDRRAAYGYPRLVHRRLVPRYQRMPSVQIAALGHEPVGAGVGKPIQSLDIVGIERDAVLDALFAPPIVGAAAGGDVEQPAGERRLVDFAGIVVLELQEAAACTAVAERFPLLSRHLGQPLSSPKRCIVVGQPGLRRGVE